MNISAENQQIAHVSINQKNPSTFLAPGWAKQLGLEFSKPYMQNIRNFLKKELNAGYRFFPIGHNIFRAFQLIDYDDVKVVIIGQDPYHGYGQANGLAFAVESHIPLPPSLQNIFKEIILAHNEHKPDKNTLQTKFDRTLIHWAKQGVLSLNTVLTVRENAAFSHRNRGWETFTDQVIQLLFEKKTPTVFLCWGSAASQKVQHIYDQTFEKNNIQKKSNFLILKAPHPSPLSAHRGFLGCGHFIKTNDFLAKNHLSPIQWMSL